MSNKKYRHWCDGQHLEKENHFVIGELAEKIHQKLEEHLLHDFSVHNVVKEEDPDKAVKKNYYYKRIIKMIDMAEEIELHVKDANSVFGYYDLDFAYRRKKWLEAKGLCFRLISMLSGVSALFAKGTNIQKYVNLSADTGVMATKIANIMKKDDEKRKKIAKRYLEDVDLTVELMGVSPLEFHPASQT